MGLGEVRGLGACSLCVHSDNGVSLEDFTVV